MVIKYEPYSESYSIKLEEPEDFTFLMRYIRTDKIPLGGIVYISETSDGQTWNPELIEIRTLKK